MPDISTHHRSLGASPAVGFTSRPAQTLTSRSYNGTTSDYTRDDTWASSFGGAGLVSGQNITTLAIVKYNSFADFNFLFCRWQGGAGNLGWVMYNPATSKVIFNTHTGNFTGAQAQLTSSLSTGTWYWIHGWQDTSGIKIYLNAVVDGTDPGHVNIGGDAVGYGGALTIAAPSSVDGNMLNGYAYFCAVWQASLTQGEIDATYNGGKFDEDAILSVQYSSLKWAGYADSGVDLSPVKNAALTNHGGASSNDTVPIV